MEEVYKSDLKLLKRFCAAMKKPLTDTTFEIFDELHPRIRYELTLQSFDLHDQSEMAKFILEHQGFEKTDKSKYAYLRCMGKYAEKVKFDEEDISDLVISSWNVNGMRSRILDDKTSAKCKRKGEREIKPNSALADLISQTNPNIMCFQEIKCGKQKLECFGKNGEQRGDGWYVYRNCASKGGNKKDNGLNYSGVSTWSRIPADEVDVTLLPDVTKIFPIQRYQFFEILANLFPQDEDEDGNPKSIGIGKELAREGRIICTRFGNLWIVNVYTPNTLRAGNKRRNGSYPKEHYMDRRRVWEILLDIKLRLLFTSGDDVKVILCGDLNVARERKDIWHGQRDEDYGSMENEAGAGYRREERQAIEDLLGVEGRNFLNSFGTGGRTDLWNEYGQPNLGDEAGYTFWSPTQLQHRPENKGWRIDYFISRLDRLQQDFDLAETDIRPYREIGAQVLDDDGELVLSSGGNAVVASDHGPLVLRLKRKKKEPESDTDKEKWLLLGITHTEMEEGGGRGRGRYNDPTDGGEMITFDYGEQGDANIDIRGNYYNIELWEELVRNKGENYFDVIFIDAGQHAGPGFSNFGDVRDKANLEGINKIMQFLLKPDGLLITAGSGGLGPFREGGWIKTDETIDDPFGDAHRVDRSLIFKNPKDQHDAGEKVDQEDLAPRTVQDIFDDIRAVRTEIEEEFEEEEFGKWYESCYWDDDQEGDGGWKATSDMPSERLDEFNKLVARLDVLDGEFNRVRVDLIKDGNMHWVEGTIEEWEAAKAGGKNRSGYYKFYNDGFVRQGWYDFHEGLSEKQREHFDKFFNDYFYYGHPFYQDWNDRRTDGSECYLAFGSGDAYVTEYDPDDPDSVFLSEEDEDEDEGDDEERALQRAIELSELSESPEGRKPDLSSVIVEDGPNVVVVEEERVRPKDVYSNLWNSRGFREWLAKPPESPSDVSEEEFEDWRHLFDMRSRRDDHEEHGEDASAFEEPGGYIEAAEAELLQHYNANLNLIEEEEEEDVCYDGAAPRLLRDLEKLNAETDDYSLVFLSEIRKFTAKIIDDVFGELTLTGYMRGTYSEEFSPLEQSLAVIQGVTHNEGATEERITQLEDLSLDIVTEQARLEKTRNEIDAQESRIAEQEEKLVALRKIMIDAPRVEAQQDIEFTIGLIADIRNNLVSVQAQHDELASSIEKKQAKYEDLQSDATKLLQFQLILALKMLKIEVPGVRDFFRTLDRLLRSVDLGTLASQLTRNRAYRKMLQ